MAKKTTIPNTLSDVSKVTKLINRNDVILLDDRTGNMYDKSDIMHFAVFFDRVEDGYMADKIRKPKKRLKDELGIEEVEQDEEAMETAAKGKAFTNSIICRELHIMNNRLPQVDHHGWYIVPIYEGQTEFRPVFIEEITADETYLIVQDEPLFTIDPSPFKADDDSWHHNSYQHLAAALKDNSRFYVETVFHHNRNKHDINALNVACKSYDNAKAIRIKISNNIRSNFYVTIGRKMYNELRQQIADELNKTKAKKVKPEDINIFEYIEKEYNSLTVFIKKQNVESDVSKLVKKIQTITKKSEAQEAHDEILKYMVKINTKMSDTYISSEQQFAKLKDELGLKFIISLSLYNQVREYKKYEEIEANSEAYMKELVHKHPYWNRFFVQLHGTAEIIAAYMICGLNPSMARHPSAFQRYVGMDQVIAEPSKDRVITKDLQVMCLTNLVQNYFTVERNCQADDVVMSKEIFVNYKGDFLCYRDYEITKAMVEEFNYKRINISNGTLKGLIEEDFDNIIGNATYANMVSSVLEKTDYKTITDPKGSQFVRLKKRARNKSDAVTSTYISSSGTIETRSGFGYNSKLKGKIVGVWATNVIKLGGIDKETGEYKSPYTKRYYEARARYESRPDLVYQLQMAEKKVKGFHKPNFHVMGRRVMCQQFLEDCWFAMRTIDNLPLNGGTYAEAKLGIIHNQDRPGVLPVACYTKEDYKQWKKENDMTL